MHFGCREATPPFASIWLSRGWFSEGSAYISTEGVFFGFRAVQSGIFLTKLAPQAKILRLQGAANGILCYKMSVPGEKSALGVFDFELSPKSPGSQDLVLRNRGGDRQEGGTVGLNSPDTPYSHFKQFLIFSRNILICSNSHLLANRLYFP